MPDVWDRLELAMKDLRNATRELENADISDAAESLDERCGHLVATGRRLTLIQGGHDA